MTIKVISLNIWMGGRLYTEALSFLKAQNADVILLQEVHNGDDASLAPEYRTVELMRQYAGLPYDIFSPNVDQPNSEVLIGNAIFSRFPITHIVDPLLPKRTYNLQSVQLDTPVGVLSVFNIHGPWDMDGDHFSPERQEMSEHILGMIKNHTNIILAGDTNAKPTNKAISGLNDNLKNIFGDKLQTTFNMKHKDDVGYATAAVDMMFVSPTIDVIEYDCPNVDISDHLPLIAKLDIQ